MKNVKIKTFDADDLFKYYYKRILNESKKEKIVEREIVLNFDSPKIKNKELELKIKNEVPKRCKTVLYYEDDPTLLPSSFQISYSYYLNFNLDEIRNDFIKEKIDLKKSFPKSDDDFDKMIQQKIQKKDSENKIVKKKVIDFDSFYVEILKKNFPSYKITGKINDLVASNKLNLKDYSVYSLVYSTQVDFDLLNRHLQTALKQGKKSISIPFGYEVGFASNDKKREKSLEEVLEFAIEFSKAFDKYILTDTKYYTISKTKQ